MNADRNLLFGILAFQLNFIDRHELLAAFDRWMADKNKPLGQILVELGKLDVSRWQLINALVVEHLKQHGGAAEKSLAAVSSIRSVRADLERIADPDVAASLIHMSGVRDSDSRAISTVSAAFAKMLAPLCVAHLLGICVAVIIAAWQIETIVGSGPLFSILGLLVAFGGQIRRSSAAIVLGLSTGVLSLFLFVLILSLGWGPDRAAHPVTLMLIGYEIVFVPVGLMALSKALIGLPKEPAPVVWQFSLRSLLTLTSVVAIALAGVKATLNQRASVLLAVAVGLAVATVSALGLVGIFAFRHRCRTAG